MSRTSVQGKGKNNESNHLHSIRPARCPSVCRNAKARPKNNEILIKIRAVSINAADSHLMRADPFPVRFAFGLFKPKIQTLGADIAGQVEAAALLMASITALQGLLDLAKIKAGHNVLIYRSNRLKRDESIGRVGQGQT